MAPWPNFYILYIVNSMNSGVGHDDFVPFSPCSLRHIDSHCAMIDSTKKILGYRRSCWVTFENLGIFRFLGGLNRGFP